MSNQNIVSLDGSGQENSGMIEMQSAKAIQEVQASLVIAKQFPRDEEAAHAKIIKACQRVNLADAGIYTYARGGTDISGPSIRLAEAIAQYWGNLDFGWRELERRGPVSVIQAYAWEKETNTRREMTFEVKHIRNTKRGSYALKDERDIYENNANKAARRMRACILALIPGDIVDDAVDQCERTIASRTSEENVAALIEAFSKFGVNTKMIEARIQRNITAMQPANYIDLRKVYNSLKDGMSGVGDWFDKSLADQDQIESKPETQLDQFKEQQESSQTSYADEVPVRTEAGSPADPVDAQGGATNEKKPVGGSNNIAGSPPLPTESQPEKSTEPALTGGAASNPFPGCDICNGTGMMEGVDPESGEQTKQPCPECSK